MKLWKYHKNSKLLLTIRWMSLLFLILFVGMAIQSIFRIDVDVYYVEKVNTMLGL